MKLIPSRIHTFIGLVVGVALIAAPWIFQFSEDSAPTWTAIIVGAFIIVNELMTTSPSSPVKVIPMKVHIVVDVVTGIVLAASPWLFGFSDEETNAWLPHLIVGLLIIGYALVTDTDDAEDRPAARGGMRA